MNDIKTIKLFDTDFEMYGTIEEPLFMALDIADALEYSNGRFDEMLSNVDDNEKVLDGDIWFLTEYGLYELLMQSRKPIAKRFKAAVKITLRKIRTQGVSRGGRNELVIKGGRILPGSFRNFEGRESKWNRDGIRNFCVNIDDPELAKQLIADGWNIKTSVHDEQESYYLPVEVGYNIPPKVVMITGNKKTILGEDDIHKLDQADYDTADVVINPGYWNDDKDGNRQRIKAWLKSMRVVVIPDIFDDEEDALPWN